MRYSPNAEKSLIDWKYMGTTISADKLRDLILEKHPQDYMTFLDLFAIGCFLHLQGEKRAGKKAIDQVLSAASELGNKTYFSSILAQLDGNEVRFASEIHAHLEINELFDRK
jgi:hypothetical protein